MMRDAEGADEAAEGIRPAARTTPLPAPPYAWPASRFARPGRELPCHHTVTFPGAESGGLRSTAAARVELPAGTAPRVPATAAGLLAAFRRAKTTYLPGPIRLELLSPRPFHHALEFAGLYGLLEELHREAPDLKVRVWLRSALADPEPFATLPATEVVRLPDAATGADEADANAALGLLEASGGLPILLGRDGEWESLLATLPHPWVCAELPNDFQWRLPHGPAAAAATAGFSAALAASTPRWLAAPNHEGGCAGPSAGSPSRFLVFQARSHLGDALWLTPLLRTLRHRWPEAEVTVLAAAGAVPALAGNPHVTEILQLPEMADVAARRGLRRELARRGFDAALFGFARRPQTLWIAEAAADLGIPWRVNLEYFDAAGDGTARSPLFTQEGWFFWGTLPSPSLMLHLLDPFRAGGEAGIGERERRIEMNLKPGAHDEAEAALHAAGIGSQPFAILAPAARSSVRWPARKFAALARRIAAELGLHVLVEAGASAADAAILAEVRACLALDPGGDEAAGAERGVTEIHSASRVIAVRHDSFAALAALISRARLLVANDSAPIHLAEATATPTLYFAHREKLLHSHPANPACRALYDDRRNRPARISVAAALAAVQAVASAAAARTAAGTAGSPLARPPD